MTPAERFDRHAGAIRKQEDLDRLTARQIISARLGRCLGPLATMPRDLRNALYRLAMEMVRA